MLTRHTILIGSALCLFAPALAQDSEVISGGPAQHLRATAAYPLRQDSSQWLGSNLITARVMSASNERIGWVTNLILNDNGTVEAAVIKVGGFMGFGGKNVAVTYDSLNIVRNRNGDAIDRVTVAATKDDLRRAAAFKSLRQQLAELKEKR